MQIIQGGNPLSLQPIGYLNQERMSSATFSRGNRLRRKPDYSYSTNIYTYFLNFSLSFIFLCSKYTSKQFYSFICLSTSFNKNMRASRTALSPYV